MSSLMVRDARSALLDHEGLRRETMNHDTYPDDYIRGILTA